MNVAFAFTDDSMPRTAFYDLFARAVRKSPRYMADETAADMLLPAEDTALETNWPRYGNQASAFTRGAYDFDRYNAYIQKLAGSARPLCIVNMHPFLRLPLTFHAHKNIFVADGCLPVWERTLNPRTVSMPALPIVASAGPAPLKPILASFRGVLSHPCRAALQKLHDGKNFVCEIVARDNHVGVLDATMAKGDAGYAELMSRSLFAFIPRGDALFSYRLLEAMSFGCIPIILSDGWVLPFDRTIDWQNVVLSVPEASIPAIPGILQHLSWPRISELQNSVRETYAAHFATLDVIVETLFAELSDLIGK